MTKKYDLIIVGAGPAGLTAAVYAERCILDILILGEIPGGTITEAHKVCNFPSEKEIPGMELAFKMLEHVKSLGVKIKQEKVQEIKKQNNEFKIKTNKEEYFAKKIILAIGMKKEKLNIKGENKFLGKGVSHCASCDACLFKNKTVAVIGGSNAALTSALLLAKHAKKVYIIYRREKFFRAELAWIKQVEKNKKIKTIFNSNIKEIYGNEKVEGVKLYNSENIKIDGIFVEIGSVPDRNFLKRLSLETEGDYVKVNKKQQTSIEGIYAAGDVTNNPLKQIITACGEGAVAATSAYEEIRKNEK